MASFLSAVVSILIIIPLIGYLLVFIISKLMTRQHKKSVHIALDISTFLLIISVHYLILTIWNKSYFWIVILFMLFEAIAFVIVYWKVKKEINFAHVLKGYWRFNFLVFFSIYFVLMLFGVIKSISQSIM
ncbi:DUF3397 domain-containing protein [Bacillus massilinigeriensis]|uniref:DUF3397 domain-containing protein n=1 Tax=Bacillus massilionigeriensis TaxID=1805475 RepID=UPI00096ADE68|nr:DUF3397 domain-containing protein [Bacillus massilionigeriensis]